MASLQIEPLPLSEDAADWFARMEAAKTILEVSCGQSMDSKTYLIAVIGKDALSLLKDLLSPKNIDAVAYDVIKSTLLTHLVRQRLEIAERFAFYAVVQEDGESVSLFFSRLKKAAEHCNFGSYLDDMLRDRLVLGCRSEDARRKLLQTDKLTLSDALDILRSFEAVGLAKGEMALPMHNVNSRKPYHAKHSTVPQAARSPSTSSRLSTASKRTKEGTGKSCYRCGSKDFSAAHICPALNQTCKKCGKKNHFAKVCMSKALHHLHVESTELTHEVLHVQSLPANTCSSRVTINILAQDVVMELDTGAAATVISESVWRDLGSPTLTTSDQIFTAYDGHRILPLGKLHTSLCRGDKSVEADVTVLKADRPFGLLGRDLIPLLAPEASVTMIHTIDTHLPAIKMQPVKIEKLPNARNKFCKARPVPLALEGLVKTELASLEKRGIIKPASASECASPIVWVKKKSGGLRMCADFSIHVNDSIKSDAYPLPCIETIFSGLSGSKFYAKLDLREAYWQIPIDQRSQELCTINTSNGLYRMMRLPKGLKTPLPFFSERWKQS